MDTILEVLLGIGLSAAAGFRVFVPMFIMSLAAQWGHLTLAPGFQWLGTPAATIVLGLAMIAEILSFLFPWVSNALDSIATPAAAIAGIIIMASVLTDMSPLVRWALAIIAGGGVALTVQGTTVVTRAAAAGASGGVASPIVGLLEALSSLIVTIATFIIPAIMGIIVLIAMLLVLRIVIPKFRALRMARKTASKV